MIYIADYVCASNAPSWLMCEPGLSYLEWWVESRVVGSRFQTVGCRHQNIQTQWYDVSSLFLLSEQF